MICRTTGCHRAVSARGLCKRCYAKAYMTAKRRQACKTFSQLLERGSPPPVSNTEEPIDVRDALFVAAFHPVEPLAPEIRHIGHLRFADANDFSIASDGPLFFNAKPVPDVPFSVYELEPSDRKRCPHCKEWKPQEAFAWQWKDVGRRMSWCRRCHGALRKRRYQAQSLAHTA